MNMSTTTNTMPSRKEIKESLEHYIDRSSVQCALDILGEICSEKAQHISENWHDEQLAKLWDNAAQVCFKASVHKSVKVLP
jgi:hypothetical protein